ncbi:MAG: hypothetical protein ACUVTX_05350, partial [Bacteroidales bacterium]
MLFPPGLRKGVENILTLQDNPSDPQLLINGRVWQNIYIRVFGHQFFATSEFLTGSLTFNGRHYTELNLKYDIVNDELLLAVPYKPIIILNKEMVDSFRFTYGNRTYNIVNMGNDSASVVRGYVNVLYEGHTGL